MRTLLFLLVLLPGLARADVAFFPARELDHTRLFQEFMGVGLTCHIIQTNRVIEGGRVVLETIAGEKLGRVVTAGQKILLNTVTGKRVRISDARPRLTTRYIRLDCKEPIDASLAQVVLDSHDMTPTWRARRLAEAQAESARREALGVTLSGVVFSTDTDGIARLHALMVKAQRKTAAGKSVKIRGRTKAGSKVLVTSAAQAEAMYDAASGYVEAVQAALDTLFDELDAMTLTGLKALDVRTWVGWP